VEQTLMRGMLLQSVALVEPLFQLCEKRCAKDKREGACRALRRIPAESLRGCMVKESVAVFLLSR
jgi:hypothetical protein